MIKLETIDAICPYYIKCSKSVVYCEGVIPNTEVRQVFPEPRDKCVYFRRYCASQNYKNCAYAKVLTAKYK